MKSNKALQRLSDAIKLLNMAHDMENLRVEHIISEAREKGLKI